MRGGHKRPPRPGYNRGLTENGGEYRIETKRSEAETVQTEIKIERAR